MPLQNKQPLRGKVARLVRGRVALQLCDQFRRKAKICLSRGMLNRLPTRFAVGAERLAFYESDVPMPEPGEVIDGELCRPLVVQNDVSDGLVLVRA